MEYIISPIFVAGDRSLSVSIAQDDVANLCQTVCDHITLSSLCWMPTGRKNTLVSRTQTRSSMKTGSFRSTYIPGIYIFMFSLLVDLLTLRKRQNNLRVNTTVLTLLGPQSRFGD